MHETLLPQRDHSKTLKKQNKTEQNKNEKQQREILTK